MDMDKKKALKNVLDLCKQGKFKESLNILQSINGEINNKLIMAVIIGCCNCVANNIRTENVSESDLFNLLKHIVVYLKDLNETDLLSYVQSLFHIMKSFTKKKCYQLIARTECVLVPSFLPLSLPEKHSETYQSTASLLHNFIIKADCSEFESLLEICNIISKMYMRISNISALLSTSLNCAIHLTNLSCPLTTLKEFYLNILDLAKLNNMKVDTEQDFKNFLSHFILIYHNIVKELNFKEAGNFYVTTFQIAVEIFDNDDYINVLTVMKFPLLLAPPFEDKLDSLKKCRSSLQKLKQKCLLENKLHGLIYTVVFSYYKSGNGANWCNFSEVCRLELLRFVWELGRLELLSKFSCPCKCLVEKNISKAFSYSHYISTLLEISARQKNTTSNFNESGATLLNQFCEDIKVLKGYNCEKWRSMYNALGMAFYNIGVHIYQNSHEACTHYFYSLIKNYIRFELHDGTSISKFSMIGSAFLAVLNFNVKDHKKCLALTALGVRLCPNQKNNLLINWIKTKVMLRDSKTVEGNEMQKVTLVSAFKCFKKEMDFLADGTRLLTVNDKIDLLVSELDMYKKKWKSKVPMMSVLKELCEIADLDKTVEVIVNIFGDCELMLHEDVPKILQRTLKRYEEKISQQKRSDPQATVFLAALYFMHYKYCVKDTITKNADDMERTMSITQKTDEPPDAIPKDPSEECDIVSFYDSLNLSRYFGVMKYLNKSLELFASVVTDHLESSNSPAMVFGLLVKVSMEYRLHRYSVKSLQALQLALKVAQSENNAADTIWAIAFIVENSDVTKSYIKYLLLIADRLLDNIEYTSIPNLKVVLTYYICKAKSLLYVDYKEAYRIFQMANKLYEVQEDKSELKIIKSQLYMLHFKFVMMPCKFGIVDHKESTLLTIHNANATVYEAYRNKLADSSYEMSVLLDTNEELVKLFHSLRSPREARTYCKETIILAQHLVLPIRCAYYLVYLAHADLRSSRYDDCQVKMEGLAEILCLKKYSLHVDQENKPPSCGTEAEKDIVDLTNDMQEMVLDLPVPKYYRKQLSPSSPTFVIQPFHLPSFVHHEENCDCFYCVCLEYQVLVLEKTRLDALLNVKQNSFTISGDFFRGALNFYEACSKKYESSVETVAKVLSYDLIPDFDKQVLGAYGFVLLDYSFHLMRTKNKDEALKVTEQLIHLVSSSKIQHIYLYNEALFQKLCYITEIPTVARASDRALEMDTLCPEQNVVSTTPESKHSKVNFLVQHSPNLSPPKRRVKKCLPFNLSPSQDGFNNNKPPEKSSPTSKQPKTPAPKLKKCSNGDTVQKAKSSSSIFIYTDESKKVKKKVQINDDSCTSIINSAMKTPISIKSVSSESGMRTRTKLLTDKLRQSTKKSEVPVVIVSDDSNDQLDVPNDKKKSFRKNLFEKEKVETNVPQGGAIRKSARNRKV